MQAELFALHIRYLPAIFGYHFLFVLLLKIMLYSLTLWQDGSCKFVRSEVITAVAKFEKAQEKSKDQLKISVAKVGPVSVGIGGSSQGFIFYK